MYSRKLCSGAKSVIEVRKNQSIGYFTFPLPEKKKIDLCALKQKLDEFSCFRNDLDMNYLLVVVHGLNLTLSIYETGKLRAWHNFCLNDKKVPVGLTCYLEFFWNEYASKCLAEVS